MKPLGATLKNMEEQIYGLVQDCSDPIASAPGLLQSSTKQSKSRWCAKNDSVTATKNNKAKRDKPLLRRHNGSDGVNHQPRNCLLNPSFRRRSKKTSKLRVTGLCEGNSPRTGEYPAQMASNAENGSIW